MILRINTLLLAAPVLAFFSCSDDTQTGSGKKRQQVAEITAQAAHPFLTTDNKGDVIVSYVKQVNDSTEQVCCAFSKDQGATFTQAVEIPNSDNVHGHGENMPKVVCKPDGDIVAMWGASHPTPQSKYSGLVFYSQSFDHGTTWTNPVRLVTDTSAYDQRYFDMALLPSGEVMAIWLDNRGGKTRDGSTLLCAVRRGREGFRDEKIVGESCCPCCRTDLLVDRHGEIHISYRDIINDSIRDMVHQVSRDGGRSFSGPVRISADNWVISGCPHTGPTVAKNQNGLHFAWYTMGGGQGVYYCSSRDNGKTFSMRDTVSGNASARHPQLCALDNGNLVIVWDESVKYGGKTNSRIGMQVRDATGKIVSSRFITAGDAVDEFPVLLPVGDDEVIIAYSRRTDEKKSVMKQTVAL